MRSTRATATATSVLAVLLVAGGCSTSSPPASEDTAPVVFVSGDARLPYDTFRDWVSYADAVVVMTVEQVEVGDLTEQEISEGSGLKERRISATVDDTIWRHPAANQPPATLEFVGLPFVLRGEALRESRMGLAPWMNEGERFVVPITETIDEGWIPLNVEAAVPLTTTDVLEPSEDIGGITSDLMGLSTAELADILNATASDPVAEKNRNLDPDARYRAVVAAKPPEPVPDGES